MGERFELITPKHAAGSGTGIAWQQVRQAFTLEPL